MGSATTAGGGEYAGGDELRDAHAHERVSRPMNQRTTTVAPMPDRDHLDSSTRVIDEVQRAGGHISIVVLGTPGQNASWRPPGFGRLSG
jgi:hypothetical protein